MAEINESPLRPELGQAKFFELFSSHCSHEATNILQLALKWRRKTRTAQASPRLSLSMSCGLLGWLSQGLATVARADCAALAKMFH